MKFLQYLKSLSTKSSSADMTNSSITSRPTGFDEWVDALEAATGVDDPYEIDFTIINRDLTIFANVQRLLKEPHGFWVIGGYDGKVLIPASEPPSEEVIENRKKILGFTYFPTPSEEIVKYLTSKRV